jgi:F-type H+-transporting ATPase subunit gamma
MPQSLKIIKNRINSIENVHKVTSAMQMIAVAKFNRAQKINNTFKSYFSRIQTMRDHILAKTPAVPGGFLAGKVNHSGICLCVITADAGLCGMYNNNILRACDEFILAHNAENINLVIIGKKGWHHFFQSGRIPILKSYLGMQGKFSQSTSDDICQLLSGQFLKALCSRVYIAYTHYENATSLRPLIEKFLPLEYTEATDNDNKYLYEPKAEEIYGDFIPHFLRLNLKSILLDSFTCEHASRTVAMKKSAENAKELLGSLIMIRNKTRQAAITQEMLEIISSGEALKG